MSKLSNQTEDFPAQPGALLAGAMIAGFAASLIVVVLIALVGV